MINQQNTYTGNKGEWSEIYVFLRLIDTGQLNVADDNLRAIPNEFYKILEIIRKETSTTNYYVRDDDIVIIRVLNDRTKELEAFSFPIAVFAQKADELLSQMLKTNDRKHQSIAEFLKEIRVSSIKDIGHKRDITIKIEDFHNGMAQELGFSIKSFIGANSTLFNAGTGTNFIYRVIPPNGTIIDCDTFNTETYCDSGKIAKRFAKLKNELKCQIVFEGVQSKCLDQNLKTIDYSLPLLLSQLLQIRFLNNTTDIKSCTKILTELNPLGFDTKTHGPVYEYKVKRFLQDCAMGMTPETPWLGLYDATGGQIIVKEDGEIVCYHIYELNRFMEYLFNSTRFESPSTSEDENHPGYPRANAKKTFFYGWLYQEGNEYRIKLNLQVRFK